GQDLAAAVQEVVGAVHLAADEGVGTAHDGRHHPAVRAAGDGVDPEHHAPAGGIEQRLHQHGNRLTQGAGGDPGLEHDADGGGGGVGPSGGGRGVAVGG